MENIRNILLQFRIAPPTKEQAQKLIFVCNSFLLDSFSKAMAMTSLEERLEYFRSTFVPDLLYVAKAKSNPYIQTFGIEDEAGPVIARNLKNVADRTGFIPGLAVYQTYYPNVPLDLESYRSKPMYREDDLSFLRQ